jgi:hypothetical protein
MIIRINRNSPLEKVIGEATNKKKRRQTRKAQRKKEKYK